MERSEQLELVLGVLEAMDKCIRSDVKTVCHKGKYFNLHRDFGICWHVYAHTPDCYVTGIGWDFLKPEFKTLGLDDMYPVETQIPNVYGAKASIIHMKYKDQYSTENEVGPIRIKLLRDLIAIYKKELAEL